MAAIVSDITGLPVETQELIVEAEKVYKAHFSDECLLGRCIFLSFYCSVNTCDFCFRSIADNKGIDPAKARRSLSSILTEALLIKNFNWRLEFLTGGYNIYPKEELFRIAKLVHSVTKEKMWINLGILPTLHLKALSDYMEGVVASVETLEENLHNKTCPDKPLEPYKRMLVQAKEIGYLRSMTIIIGLGEDKTHFKYVEEFIKEYDVNRITVYALKPLAGTPYTTGPSSNELLWWIAKIRMTFPKLEIIVGISEDRLEEIHLVLRAGANSFTKIPATKMFNTDDAKLIEREVKKAGRAWKSVLYNEDVKGLCDWDAQVDALDINDEERKDLRDTLFRYLEMMQRKLSFSGKGKGKLVAGDGASSNGESVSLNVL